MRKHRTAFFDEPREESLIKLRILERYLVPWSSKIGSISRGQTIWVIDGFAGPGTYSDPDHTGGSPKRILDHARNVAARGLDYRVGCLFVEQVQKHYVALRQLCSTYGDVSCDVLKGDFWKRIPEITARIAGQPVFIVVDPFGIMGMDYEELGGVARASPKCDLVVTFFENAIPRIKGQYPEHVHKAIGPEAPGDESSAVTFARNMTQAGGFLVGGRFPIKQSFNSAKRYELVVFSRSPHAYRLWNNFVTQEWQALRRLDVNRTDNQPQLLGFGEAVEQASAEEERRDAANDILRWLGDGKLDRFARGHVLDEFAVNHFGDYHSSTLIQAVNLLNSEGRIATSDPKRNDTTLWRVVSLAPL